MESLQHGRVTAAAVGRDLVPPPLRARYEAAGQGHVFRYVDALNGPATPELEVTAFLESLAAIDPAAAVAAFKEATGGDGHTAGDAAAAASDGSALVPLSSPAAPPGLLVRTADLTDTERAALSADGLVAIARGAVGVLILAGGQGTRLGVGVKGELDGGLPSHTPLFEVYALRLARLKALAAAAAGLPGGAASVCLPLYVMTSHATDAETRRFFAAHAHFGLSPGDVMFVVQASMPCFGAPGTPEDGRMLLEAPLRLAMGPGGNGCLFAALAAGGALDDMASRGITGLHVSTVDNIACRLGDPLFTGLCAARRAHVASKVVRKAGPRESVGLLALRRAAGGGGAASSLQLTAVEYSELDEATASAVDPSTGRLAFDAGNACIHYFSLPFLRAAAAAAAASPARPTAVGTAVVDPADPSTWALPRLRYHAALKLVPRVAPDGSGRTLTRAELEAAGPAGKGVKLEALAFDTFPEVPLPAALVVEVDRAAEFAPIKNAPSQGAVDTPDTARALLSALHARWLRDAGATVVGDDGGDARVEVHPLVSYAGEGLGALAGRTLHAPLLVAPAGILRGPVDASVGDATGAGIGGHASPVSRSFGHTHTVSAAVSVVLVAPELPQAAAPVKAAPATADGVVVGCNFAAGE